jgi:vacuolar iron transporter family protein
MYNIFMQSAEDLKEHLQDEHRISPIQTYLKEIVYGGSDGIVTTFAVVAGFTGAQMGQNIPNLSFLTVLLFGLANLFADGLSMGLSNFLSLRSEKDIYKKEQAKELYEIRHHPDSEKEETITILKQRGFDERQAKELTAIYMTNEKYWLRFMMNDELELPNPLGENPHLTGLATFSAFIAFGFIPLIPYILVPQSPGVFLYACIAALAALICLGILRWRVTAEHVVRTISETILVGSAAALVAYLVGTFFRL